jgi:hypothetical protein
MSSSERAEWQSKLETEYVPKGIDAALIAAIVSEEGQTYKGINQVLQTIADTSSDDISSSAYDDSQKDSSQTETEETNSSSIDAKEQEERVDQLLQEWKHIDIESNLADNLQMTDEEDISKESEGGEGDDIHIREAKRLGEASSTGLLDVDQVAAGKEDVTSASASRYEAILKGEDGPSDLAFLMHAFPSRTPLFLEEILEDEHGSVEQVIDTLTVMEMVENGDLDEEYLDAKVQSRGAEKGLDYGLLENGTRQKKKNKNERRRRKEQINGASAMSGVSKGAPQKINLTDIRQGGPSVMHLPHKAASVKKEMNNDAEDDAAMAARLDAEERKAAGLPLAEDEEDTVQDNDWLFSNSILDQLSDLLDLPSHKVRSTHNTCHFNLRATTQRLITINCQEWPTLTSLDKAGDAPAGTASTILDGLTVLLPYKARSEVERAFRGTKGRQDATIDLIQLIDVVEKSAVGEKTDILDPMKASRDSKEVAVPTDTRTQQVGNRRGHFDFVGQDPPLMTPGDVPYSQITKRSMRNGAQSASRKYAMEALKAGAASTSFPLNSAHMDSTNNSSIPARSMLFEGAKRHETQSEAEKLAMEYRTIANEYQARREQSLIQAASAYRSLPGGGASKQLRGAAAWVYADEARRLDSKARAFSLKAAQATVRHRMMMSSTLPNTGNSTQSQQRRSPDVVDLHGLTVHESLSITKEALSAWWARSSSGSVHPLYIVTGVGRHSKGQVAVIRPAILKMLDRDGWIVSEQREGQIVVKGLR